MSDEIDKFDELEDAARVEHAQVAAHAAQSAAYAPVVNPQRATAPNVVKLLGPTGNKAIINVRRGDSANEGFYDGQPPPSPIDLLAWETEGAKPTELEVLVYPRFQNEGGVVISLPADQLIMQPVFDAVRAEISWSMGAGYPANSVRHSTISSRGSSDTTEVAHAMIPDHGIKFRVACRSLRVRLFVVGGPIVCQVVGSASPVTGGVPSPVIPHVTKLHVNGVQIPFGATEFRIISVTKTGVMAPGENIEFFHTLFARAGILRMTASECENWRPIPGQFTHIRNYEPTNLPTIQYR